MAVRLDGRVALVTGAGGGLGREHALMLARLGAKVVVNDVGATVHGEEAAEAPADRVAGEIVAAGGEAIAHHESIAEPEGATSLVQLAVETFGRVDVLVNNAGILRDKTFAKMSLEDFEAVLAVHLMGTVFCTHAAWPRMLEQGYGRVVVTTSGSATNGNFGQSNYAAAKLGVVGLMNVLALEGERKGVLINAIAPAAATRMTTELIPGDMRDYLGPDLVSSVVAYLCSEACTDTGRIISSVAGNVSRVHYAESPGVQFDPREPLDPDDVEAAWAEINDLSEAKPVSPGPLGDMVGRLSRMGLIE
jgi:NAD(P)-dependent dehydrogenase (short-subunit alcohol dehydrogenase family)